MLVWVFQDGHLEGPLGFHSSGAIACWLPLFLFVILFGLSMDYHVFILSRVRELVDRGHSTRDAVREGVVSTAGTVTSAALVMVAVFAIFATLGQLELKQMGVGLATAILIDATLVRAVLLPATMQLLGERNWYLPRWLEWLPRVSWEGEARCASASCDATTVSRVARQQRRRRRRARRAERRGQSRRLLGAGDEQHERARRVERRERQRDALGRRLGRVADADDAPRRLERGVAGEQRGRVPVRAEPEQRHVEDDVAELALVGVRGVRRRELAANGVPVGRNRGRASRGRGAGSSARRPAGTRRSSQSQMWTLRPVEVARLRAARSSDAASRRRTARGERRRAASTPRRARRRAARPRAAAASSASLAPDQLGAAHALVDGGRRHLARATGPRRASPPRRGPGASPR